MRCQVHPAKLGWQNTYRAPGAQVYCNQPSKGVCHSQLQIFDGFLNMNAAAWEAALDYIVDTYFSQPNYLRVETEVTSDVDGSTSE